MQVSIIIPFYNAANLLHLSINSLKNQIYKDFEVIMVNDGSIDNSCEIAKELIGNDSRFSIINQKNAGPGAARNAGIKVAKGHYIGFIDSDDYFHSDFIKLMVEKILHDNADIVICEIQKVDDNGNVIRHYPIAYDRPIGKMEAFADIMQSINISSMTQNKLFRKELFYNVEFPVDIKVNEDSATVYRLILNADIVSFVNMPLFYYVQHTGSSMNSFDFSKLSDRFKVADMIRTYMLNNNLSEYMYLYNIYYLQNVALSGALQIARFSDEYNNDIEKLISNIDKNIFSIVNIIKLLKNAKNKAMALIALKISKRLFRFIALSLSRRK